MNPLNRQVVLENRVVCACRYCWSEAELLRVYPELQGLPITSRTCETHFEVLLANAMALFPVRPSKPLPLG